MARTKKTAKKTKNPNKRLKRPKKIKKNKQVVQVVQTRPTNGGKMIPNIPKKIPTLLKGKKRRSRPGTAALR